MYENSYKIIQDVIDRYDLHTETKKGMYGLKQATILAYYQLVKNLAPLV